MRAVRTLTATALATLGLLVVTPHAALANYPAPSCDTGGSSFICDAANLGPTTWTVSRYESGSWFTYTTTTSGSTLIASCRPNMPVHVSTSYVADGVTQYSDLGGFVCYGGPWQ
ncbi:hypothetical protein R8Z50_19460 [Longispora sp. K20-0274]|uniref:hypothetical protein n=1 Tax=Longispora sp. K20-0274 TaxID=3088255 RepID=UPI00399C0277